MFVPPVAVRFPFTSHTYGSSREPPRSYVPESDTSPAVVSSTMTLLVNSGMSKVGTSTGSTWSVTGSPVGLWYGWNLSSSADIGVATAEFTYVPKPFTVSELPLMMRLPFVCMLAFSVLDSSPSTYKSERMVPSRLRSPSDMRA